VAEAEGERTTPSNEPPGGLVEANPHFLGRHRPTQHAQRPELRQTDYPARQMMMDFVGLVLERAKSRKSKKEVSARLKAEADRLKSAFEAFADLSADRQHELMTVVWAGYHIGKAYPGLAGDLKERTERARSGKAGKADARRKEGLRHFYEVRKKHPKWSVQQIAKEVAKRMGHQVKKWLAVRRWYYADRKTHPKP
jgi:hypothetical protein